MKINKILTVISICLLTINILHGQNITNTLGTGGIYSITDGTTTFFSLTRSNGQAGIPGSIYLQNTTDASTGVIYFGTDRFIHNYKGNNTDGFNTFTGINSGNFTLSGTGSEASYNTGLGNTSLNLLTTGSYNTGIGRYSMQNTSTGSHNTAFGYTSLRYNTTGSYNTSIGSTNTGGNFNHNTVIGTRSFSNINNSADRNIVLGNFITGFRTVNSATGNTFIGYAIAWDFGSAQFTNCIGIGDSVFNLSSHFITDIVAVGSRAFITIGDHGLGNTALGYLAGTNASKVSNHTYIGHLSSYDSYTLNVFVLGNNAVTSLRCNVTSITSLSDIRDKKNIKDLEHGLSFITSIKPREFNWDRREWYENKISDGTKTDTVLTAGFIAQELDSAQKQYNSEWLGLADTNNPERFEATAGNLLPVLVKAIQEIKLNTDQIKKNTDEISTQTIELENRIKKLNQDYEAIMNRLEETSGK